MSPCESAHCAGGPIVWGRCSLSPCDPAHRAHLLTRKSQPGDGLTRPAACETMTALSDIPIFREKGADDAPGGA